jgi:tetratricopeptide (TPR) repeat protein
MRRTLFLLSVMTLFMSLSGFECASTEMTTAKVAIKGKDYKKAEEALRKEVAARPLNGQAWLMLGDIHFEQGRFVEMKNDYEKAVAGTTPAISAEEKANIGLKVYKGWEERYNSAYRLYSKKDYAGALLQLDTADVLRPGFPENVYFRATVNAGLKDDPAAVRAYNTYIDVIRPEVEEGMKLGLALGMSQKGVEAKLGKPTKQNVVDSTGGFAYYDAQKLYVYFAPSNEGKGPRVEGWKFYRDNTTPEVIREVPVTLRSAPYVILGLAAEKRAEYDNALRYLQTVSRLDPESDVDRVVSNIYIKTNRTSEAIALLEQAMIQSPNDPTININLGNLLFQMENYTRAADEFKKVVNMKLERNDPNLHTALFNLGAVYKNWGAKMQKDAGSTPSKAQNDAIQKQLRESVTYFEQLRDVKPDDFTVLAELGNLYEVLGEKAKVQSTVKLLEAVQSANADNKSYWRALSRLYAITGDIKKAEDADRKAR